MSCLHALNCQLTTKETQALLINPKSNDPVQYAVFLWEKKTAAKEFKKKKSSSGRNNAPFGLDTSQHLNCFFFRATAVELLGIPHYYCWHEPLKSRPENKAEE